MKAMLTSNWLHHLAAIALLSMSALSAEVSGPGDRVGKVVAFSSGLVEYGQKRIVENQVAAELKKENERNHKALMKNPGTNLYYEVQIYQYGESPKRWSAGLVYVGTGRTAVEALVNHWSQKTIGKNPRPTVSGTAEPDRMYRLLPEESYFIQLSLRGTDVVSNPVNWVDCMNGAIRRTSGK
jgi:hypothetical protein